MESRPKKLLDQVRDAIRVKHYARNTEQACVYWIKKFILFHNKRHPKEMGSGDVQAFLTHLALEEHISASTQNQALSALLFLYRNVLSQELGLVDSVRAKPSQHVPTDPARLFADTSGCPYTRTAPACCLGQPWLDMLEPPPVPASPGSWSVLWSQRPKQAFSPAWRRNSRLIGAAHGQGDDLTRPAAGCQFISLLKIRHPGMRGGWMNEGPSQAADKSRPA